MSEQTPDRLRQFREQYGQAPRQRNVLGVVNLILILVGFGTLAFMLVRMPAPQAPGQPLAGGGLTVDQEREFAVRLAEKKEMAGAIAAYDSYLKKASLPAADRAKVCYSVAKLAIDTEQYAVALPYLYQAEFLDPQSNLKDEINKKVVLCLDKLGRNVDLRHELRQRTDVKRTAADVKSDEKVLAEFAGEVVTDRDLDNEIDKLPTQVRGQFDTPEKKTQYLKNIVAERLLLDKAKRLELDKSPEVQAQLLKQLDAMMVQRLIADEVKKSVQVTPEDVERFYKAEPARFTEPATAEVSVGKANSEEAAKALTSFADKPVTVRKGGPVPGEAPELKVPESIFASTPGAVSTPVQAGAAWYVFKTAAVTPEKLHPFEEVKDQAARLLQMQKEQEKVSALIEETLQARDVKLYPERLGQTKGAP